MTMPLHVHCKLCGYDVPVSPLPDNVIEVKTNEGFTVFVHRECLTMLKSAVCCLDWNIDEPTFKKLVSIVHA